MPLVRFIIPFVLAGFVTFGLFYLMQSLIGVEGQLDDSDKIKVVDFVVHWLEVWLDMEVSGKKSKVIASTHDLATQVASNVKSQKLMVATHGKLLLN